MPTCPKCQQPVERRAIQCSHCGNPLKAYGHPGIPLYQAENSEFLCESCTYHHDDTCDFPQRPYAKTCTLYHDYTQPLVSEFKPSLSSSHPLKTLQRWFYRHRALLLITALILISIAITLST